MATNDLTRVKVSSDILYFYFLIFVNYVGNLCFHIQICNYLFCFRELLLLNQLYMEIQLNILDKNDMKMAILIDGLYM